METFLLLLSELITLALERMDVNDNGMRAVLDAAESGDERLNVVAYILFIYFEYSLISGLRTTNPRKPDFTLQK